MKALIAMLAILCLFFTTQSVFARGGGNLRYEIDRRWKEVEALKKKQDQDFRKIERDADRSRRDIRGQDGPGEGMSYPRPRTCP